MFSLVRVVEILEGRGGVWHMHLQGRQKPTSDSQQRLVSRWRVCARDSCVQGKDLSNRRVVGETTLTRRGRRQRIIKACKELLLLYAALSQSIVVKAGRHLDSEITIYAPLDRKVDGGHSMLPPGNVEN